MGGQPMAHPVVEQLRFTRGEWRRGLTGLTEKEGAKHFGQMNSASWVVGHLAWHEQRVVLYRPQGILIAPELQEEFYSGAPMSTTRLPRRWSRSAGDRSAASGAAPAGSTRVRVFSIMIATASRIDSSPISTKSSSTSRRMR